MNPEELESLPTEWISPFRESVTIGDMDEALRLLEELDDQVIVKHFELLIREYRIQEI